MARPEKVQAVADIKERLEGARAVFLAEYSGLSVKEQQELRRSLRAAEAEFKVVKMSLARRAAAELNIDNLDDLLLGPTGLAFADRDPVEAAKALKEFAASHEALVVKGGLLGNDLLTPERVSALAEIEPREVLLSRLAGGFQAPMARLANLVSALPRNMANAMLQLLDKKEEAQPAPIADAPETAAVATPAEEAPEEVPTPDAPEAEAVTEEAAVAEAPEAEAPAEEAPEAEAVTEEAPEAEAPAEEAPEAEAPAEEAPEAEAVAEEAPEAEAVAEEAPAEEAVAEKAPAKKAAVEEAPVAEAPEAEVVAEKAAEVPAKAPAKAAADVTADVPADDATQEPEPEASAASEEADASDEPVDAEDVADDPAEEDE
jgi:large subunit ribosomal protein L10